MTIDEIEELRELIRDAVEADKAAREANAKDEDILIQVANESEQKLGGFVREHSAFILAAVRRKTRNEM